MAALLIRKPEMAVVGRVLDSMSLSTAPYTVEQEAHLSRRRRPPVRRAVFLMEIFIWIIHIIVGRRHVQNRRRSRDDVSLFGRYVCHHRSEDFAARPQCRPL